MATPNAEALYKLKQLRDRMRQYAELRKRNALAFFEPTPKQREFLALGAQKRIRALLAGNQSGKSMTCAFELACHLTGQYPPWWEGHRFAGPIKAWAGSITLATLRSGVQRHLMGDPEIGTGMLPRDSIVSYTMARNVTGCYDRVVVKHATGGESLLEFKSYDSGRERWQGATLHFILLDEEPDMEIFAEALMRLNTTRGHMVFAFTPLRGYSDVVKMFLEPSPDDPGAADRGYVHMTLDDATFYTDEDRKRIIASLPEHERRARVLGLPAIGEGLIYPFPEEAITCDPFRIPPHYRRVVGIDFGIDHPCAAVWVAWDPDTDTAYVYDVYKGRSGDMAVHAAAIKQRGDWPIAWPHDGLKRMAQEGGDSKPLIELWRKLGLNFLPQSARYDPRRGGAQPKEPIIAECRERFTSGRLKVFSTCGDLLRELKSYHRKDGKPVPYNDDAISAMHYAIMSLRYARPASEMERPRMADAAYDPLRWSPSSDRAGGLTTADDGRKW